MGLTKDARDLLIECCVEFITLISSEANEISEKESKKTIACEHITKALEQLGFGDYVRDIMEVASEHKEQLKVSICLFSSLPAYKVACEPDLTHYVPGTREEGKQARAERVVYRATSSDAGGCIQGCCSTARMNTSIVDFLCIMVFKSPVSGFAYQRKSWIGQDLLAG